MKWHFLLTFFLVLFYTESSGQAFSLSIRNESVPKELISESLNGHADLIRGETNGALKKFKEDSLSGKWNESEINEILASEEFRNHSARIDTQYAMELLEEGRVLHHVAFRDIYYLGRDRFVQFRTNFSFLCERGNNLKVLKRKIVFGPKEISTQKSWGRWAWY